MSLGSAPVIGLTGGIGSGKSTVAEAFRERGAGIVDTDQIAHALTCPGQPALQLIAAAFGRGVLDEGGNLDRATLRQQVFADPDARRRLETILHPRIRAQALQEVSVATEPYVLLVVPLLVEGSGYPDQLRRILVVDVPEEVQVQRVHSRSGLDPEQIRAIMASQASRGRRLASADDVIDNAGGQDALERQVEALHQRYLTLGETS